VARPHNTQESVEIRISTTDAIREYLQQLVDTGLWGKNVTEAAERILSTRLRELLRDNELQRVEPSGGRRKLPPSNNNKLGQ